MIISYRPGVCGLLQYAQGLDGKQSEQSLPSHGCNKPVPRTYQPYTVHRSPYSRMYGVWLLPYTRDLYAVSCMQAPARLERRETRVHAS